MVMFELGAMFVYVGRPRGYEGSVDGDDVLVARGLKGVIAIEVESVSLRCQRCC